MDITPETTEPLVSCLVLFFFIVDHEMDSHAENKKSFAEEVRDKLM